MDMSRFEQRTDAMIDELRTLVTHESPTGDVERLDALADLLVDQWKPLGADVTRHTVSGTGSHLEIRWSGPAGTPQDVAPALLVGHYDTVHDVGGLRRNPWRIDEDGRARGPGTQDMKSGLVIVRHALAVLADAGAALPRPVVALVTADEEIGSPTSEALIRDRARTSAYALVFEAAAGAGALKTRRKGVGLWSVTVTGRAAHAGQHFFDGVNANVALARLVPWIAGLSDEDAQTTVNVGVLRGGTRPNVVAERARADIDVRFTDDAEAERVAAGLAALASDDAEAERVAAALAALASDDAPARVSVTSDDATTADAPASDGAARVTVDGGVNRPAMHQSADARRLFERARRCARGLGFELDEAAAGGASDGNFTAAEDAPTLDGLGGVGAGLHTDTEYVEVASLPQRAALLAALLSSAE